MTIPRNHIINKNAFKCPKALEVHSVTFVLFRTTGKLDNKIIFPC